MKIIRLRKITTYHVKDVLLIKQCRKTFLKVSIYIILLGIAVLIALLPNVLTRKKHVIYPHANYATDMKYIFFWKQAKKNNKNFFNKDETYATGQTEFIKQNCPNINCFITYNKSLLRSEEYFDAVVFNIHDIKKLKIQRKNRKRSPHQKYIFKSFEPASEYPICNPLFDNFFNWTWTYKLDSDIPHPFLNIYDSKNNLVGPSPNIEWTEKTINSDQFKNKIKRKTKAVVWLINNCKLKNKHREFVKDLKHELKGYNYTLDSYGPCSENKCKNGIDKCYKKIEEEYFFQLVLENAVTPDYVTERVEKVMAHVTIPIVLGSNFSSFLPLGSYINAGTFDMKKLGAIINYLIRNPKKYSYFFDWKKYYYYTTRPRSYVCDLCTKMNQFSEEKSTMGNLRMWWNSEYEEICESLQLVNKFKGF